MEQLSAAANAPLHNTFAGSRLPAAESSAF
jgi:hypothetical protein